LETNELVSGLTSRAVPVRRLSPPWVRTASWLVIALPAVALIVLVMSPRDDLPAKLTESRFVIEQAAALATAITAAMAAFCMIIPGQSRWMVALPVAPLTFWLGSLGQGCLSSWLRLGLDGLRIYPDLICLPSIALVGSVPAVTMLVMLRRGAPLAPRLTVALGGLAAAALGNFGLRLFHYQDASLMVLIWQFGSVALFSALASWSGKHVLQWRHIRAAH